MGNHFRTSGAGDDAPKTQAGVQAVVSPLRIQRASLLLRPPLSRQIRHSRHPIPLPTIQPAMSRFRHGGF